MFLLLVNLYEFGQFLRILLWISVPMFIVAMLVTTWLHYRRRKKTQDEMALLMGGLDLSAAPEILIAAMKRMSVSLNGAGDGAVAPESESVPAAGEGTEPAPEGEREAIAPADAVDNMYKGILWMKQKYEQYRDLADQRIEQLKEQVAKVEKKYDDLLVGRGDQRMESRADQQLESVPAAHAGPTAQDESLLQQLAAKDQQIEELQSQLQMQYLKTEELAAKLQHSSQLLLNLSHELDKTTSPQQPQA
ncbi:MAG TPA: hypothetical protein VGN00_09620 [Puia sp.]|jgi:hypothetical protein